MIDKGKDNSTEDEGSRLSEIIWPQKQFRGIIESDAFSYCGLKKYI